MEEFEVNIRDAVGGNRFVVNVESSETIFSVKQKLELQNGIKPSGQRLIKFGGTLLPGPVLRTPFLEESYDQKIICGTGEKSVDVMLLNNKNTTATFRFSSSPKPNEIESVLKELIEKIKGGLQCDVQLRDLKIWLFCGDQQINRANEEWKSLDYYYPRGDPFYAVIRGTYDGLTLRDHDIQSDTRLFSLRRFYVDNDEGNGNIIRREEIYYPDSNTGMHEGINIEGKCSSQECNEEKKIIIHFSKDVIGSSGDSFDLFYDLKKENTICKCPKCDSRIIPEKFHFLKCFWKFSSIVVGVENRSFIHKRIESNKWEEATTGDNYFLHSTFDYNEFKEKNKNNIIRFQAQARCYEAAQGSRFKQLICPEEVRCILCGQRTRMILVEEFNFGLFPEERSGEKRDTFEKSKSGCEHWFHGSCLEEWKDHPLINPCIQCNLMEKKKTIENYGDDFEKDRFEYMIDMMMIKRNSGDFGVGIIGFDSMFYFPKFVFIS